MLYCLERDYSYDPYFFATKKILAQNKDALELINSGPFAFKQRMAAFRFRFKDGKSETNYYYFILFFWCFFDRFPLFLVFNGVFKIFYL